jgi:hypothetical protein
MGLAAKKPVISSADHLIWEGGKTGRHEWMEGKSFAPAEPQLIVEVPAPSTDCGRLGADGFWVLPGETLVPANEALKLGAAQKIAEVPVPVAP